MNASNSKQEQKIKKIEKKIIKETVRNEAKEREEE